MPPISRSLPASSGAAARLSGRRLRAAQAAWLALAALTLLYVAASTPIQYARLLQLCPAGPCDSAVLTAGNLRELAALGISLQGFAVYALAVKLVFAAVTFAVGAAIFWRRADDPAALFVACALVSFGASAFSETRPAIAPGLPALEWAFSFLLFFANSSTIILFYIFPDGRFVPRWSGVLAIGVLVIQAGRYFLPGTPLNPERWPLPLGLATGGFFLSIVYAQVHRYRRISGPAERRQTKWVVFGLALAVLGSPGVTVAAILLDVRNALGVIAIYTVVDLALLAIPIAIGIAILRYQLWDINLLIKRAIVYGALTGCVAGLYVLLVGALGALFEASGSPLIALLATGLVAVLFQPLRARLQRAVNRMIYGERDDPYTVIGRLSQLIETTVAPEALFPTIVETVAQALKLPYIAILIDHPDRCITAAAAGAPVPDALRLPLIYGGDTIGQFIVGPRAPGEAFGPADMRLIEQLAPQVALAAGAARLAAERQQITDDLRRSRERLVLAREEERRRLRRDLHDGLGATLAALSLGAGAIADTIAANPAKAAEMTNELQEGIRATVGDVRRLVYALRPPALDELGLVAAIRDQVERYASANGPAIAVEAHELGAATPAAVEVAAYRIVQEALTNIVRHAQARNGLVRLQLAAGALEITIDDDGVGLPAQHRAGVGLHSMRERAEELGGELRVLARPAGGTRVWAWLPL